MEAPREPARAGSRRGFLPLLTTYLKGFAMGSADLVPGVSGGTVAMVVGVYEGLLRSLGAISRPAFLRPLLRGRFGEALEVLDARLLFPLVAGIATALVTLSRLISHLLERYPTYVMAVFFGLVAASALVVGRRVGRWNALMLSALAAGVAAGLVVVTLTPVETPESTAFLFFSGFLAICAMVLPGISGAFILVLLGKYDVALAALGRFDLTIVVPIGLGAVVGLLSFARLLSYLLARYHGPMLALLTGFMVGSLYKVWPFLAPDGGPVLPWRAGPVGSILVTTGLTVLGLGAVLLLERLSVSTATPDPSRNSYSVTDTFTTER